MTLHVTCEAKNRRKRATPLWLLLFLGPALAAPPAPAQVVHRASPPAPTAIVLQDAADDTTDDVVVLDGVDDILSLADESLESLARQDVIVPTDPIVTAVSRKPEKVSESPGIVDVITAKDIEEFGAKNLYEVLQWATSVYMTGSYLFPGNNTALRGDRFTHYDNHVLTLINGRPFRDSTLGGVSQSLYKAFPIDTIDHIEVMRGPGSVLYGTNGYVGAINIVTRNPDEPTLRMSVMAGSHGWQQYRLSGGNGTDCQGILVGADYNRTRGWPYSLTDELSVFDSSLQGQDNIGIFGMYRHGGFTANVFVADYSNEAIGVAPMWPSDTVDGIRAFVDLGYLLEFCDHQSLDLHVTYNFEQSLWDFPAPAPSRNLNTSHGYLLEATYRRELMDRMNLMVGAFADIHEGGVGISGVIPPYSETWYGVYLQVDYQVTDWLKAVGGCQGNLPGRIPGGVVPRAGFIVTPNENWTAKFLYGQAFRSPYPIERFISHPPILLGNAGLTPETIQTFDLQLSYHTDEFRFAATYFHSDYRNLITRVGASPATYDNLGTMEFQGVELENEWRFSEHLRWLGSVTYQDNVRDGVHDTTHVPNWMAKMGVAYRTENGWSLGLFDTYYGTPSPVTVVNPGALIVNPAPQAYHLMSLNATVDLDRWLHWHSGRSTRLQFLIQNLLDEPIDHPEFARRRINSIPAGPGRTFYGGFAMDY